MEVVRDGDRILAIVYRDSDWAPGLDFCTPGDLFIQAGCWYYSAGKQLGAHRHKSYDRVVNQTQEVVYVKRGEMKVFVYGFNKQLVSDFQLVAGDFAVLAEGGHGYEILEEGTQVLEVKNGPFIDVAVDKEAL